MSAEGILNDPALFVEALAEAGNGEKELAELREVRVTEPRSGDLKTNNL